MLKAPTLLRTLCPTSIKCYSSNATSLGTEKKPEKVRERPLYATRQNFEKQKLVERYGRSATEDSGVKVTKFQRRMLVLTGLYKHSKNIPEYVPYGTMNRLHDRSRVVFIVVGCLVFFTIFFTFELGTSRAVYRDRVSQRSSDKTEWQIEHEVATDKHGEAHKQSNRYSGIPAFPSDIGYHGGREVSGKKQSGVTSNVLGNPFVVIGMGLTTLALLGMLRKSFLGDKVGTQKYMRYRIMAQFFTVTALVAGVTFFGSTYDKPNKDTA
ncbi:HIG1 domain-containing protein [Aphelenchoides besseyi]|nr:HIG1 domain-containing protein [Aphelenchoides besseyi]KAI6216792.1 HIG1 domain-containing protein [Aphelenchoides besseyi]